MVLYFDDRPMVNKILDDAVSKEEEEKSRNN
jgi:hypothetical protein